MPDPAVVCDTPVLLYLGRIAQIEWLPRLFKTVYVPEAVALELDMGRLLRADTVNPRLWPWATIVPVPQSALDALPPNRLGIGERSVIAYARLQHVGIVGLDDLQARRLAESLGLQTRGTLGLLLHAKRCGYIPAVHPWLEALKMQGFRLGTDLYQDILSLAGETPSHP